MPRVVIYALLADGSNANQAIDFVRRPVPRPSLRVDAFFEHGEFYCKLWGADVRVPETVPVATQIKPIWEPEIRTKNNNRLASRIVMRLAERAFQRQANARPRKAARVAQALKDGSAHCPATPLRVNFLLARAGSIVVHGIAARVAQKESQRLRKSSRLRDPNPV